MTHYKLQPLVPAKVSGAAHVNLTTPGKAYVAARAGHPGVAPGPAATVKPSTFVKSTTTIKPGVGGNKPTHAATAQDMTQQIINRYIASLQTPAQQAAQNNAWINASLKASAAQTNAAYDQQKRDLLQQQARANQYAMALGSLRDMSGLQTEADYTNAAHNIQGLGTGLTGTIADAQQGEANQAAQQIAAATQGLGQAKGLDVEGMKNIAQYTGVTQPATNLYEEAASQAAQSRLNQDTRAQQVENIATGYGTKVTDLASDRASKLAELAATRPSLYQTAMQQAQSGTRSDMATIFSALALQNNVSKTPSEIAGNEANTASTLSKVTGFQYDPKTGKQKFAKNGQPLLAGNYWLPPGSVTPQKIPSNQHVSKDGTKLVPNATATSGTTAAKAKADRLAKQGYAPNGKTLLNSDWYWGADGKPWKVPAGQQRDPKDPTNHTVIDNPSLGGAGTTGSAAAAAKQTQRLINTWSSKFDKEMTMDASPYAVDIQDPILESAAGKKPIWAPKPGMNYAKARADLIRRLPKALKKNKQMLANIDTSLARVGFKIPKAGAKTTKTKPKGKPITAPSAGDLVGGGTPRVG